MERSTNGIGKCHGACGRYTQYTFCHNCQSRRSVGSAQMVPAVRGVGARDLSADKLAADIEYARSIHRRAFE